MKHRGQQAEEIFQEFSQSVFFPQGQVKCGIQQFRPGLPDKKRSSDRPRLMALLSSMMGIALQWLMSMPSCWCPESGLSFICRSTDQMASGVFSHGYMWTIQPNT